MNKHDLYIEQLLDRFFEGETTRSEEKILDEYFAGDNLAESLMQYKPMFNWYADGMTAEPGAELSEAVRPLARKKSGFPLKPVIWFSSVAATLAILFTAGWNYHSAKVQQEMLAKQHEGSYVMIDGVLYTDMEDISEEIEYLRLEAEIIELELNAEAGTQQDVIS